jgi:hypothetical protein
MSIVGNYPAGSNVAPMQAAPQTLGAPVMRTVPDQASEPRVLPQPALGAEIEAAYSDGARVLGAADTTPTRSAVVERRETRPSVERPNSLSAAPDVEPSDIARRRSVEPSLEVRGTAPHRVESHPAEPPVPERPFDAVAVVVAAPRDAAPHHASAITPARSARSAPAADVSRAAAPRQEPVARERTIRIVIDRIEIGPPPAPAPRAPAPPARRGMSLEDFLAARR